MCVHVRTAVREGREAKEEQQQQHAAQQQHTLISLLSTFTTAASHPIDIVRLRCRGTHVCSAKREQ